MSRLQTVTDASVATAAGAGGGALLYAVIGGLGSGALGGLSVTLGPFIAAGATLGLAGYGATKLVKIVVKKVTS